MKLFEGYYEVHHDGHEYHTEVLIQASDSLAATKHLKDYLKTFYEYEEPEWEDDRWFFPESCIYVKPGYVGETTKEKWMSERYESALI